MNINIEISNQEEIQNISENKNLPSSQNNNDELQDIKEEEEEFYPIMSRIKRDLKEKRKKKLEKKEELKNSKNKLNTSLEPQKKSFIKFSKKDMNSKRLNTLLSLEPFFSDFNANSEKKDEEFLKILSEEYKEEKYDINKIIYRYGDEADKFFILSEGNISLFMPFTEVMIMNIDEFYIYILRLRRYNEIEMINNVLLLNKGKFMVEFDEGFNLDDYILKLYNTSLKLKYDATFLYKSYIQPKKKIKKIKLVKNEDKPKDANTNINNHNENQKKKFINLKQNNINNKNTNSNNLDTIKFNESNIFEEKTHYFDDPKFKTINDREIKEVIIRIEEELIETIKYIMPDKLYDVYEEIKDEKKVKKIVKIPEELIQKYKQYNTDIISPSEYNQRILPPKILNKNLEKKEIIVMKYLHLSTISKGYYFGDFCSDSLTLFSPEYLNIAKNSRIPLKMHNHYNFRNMTAISCINIKNKDKKKNKNNNDIIKLLSFNKKIFVTYIAKFIENKTLWKKKYLLNNPLFKGTNNKNLIKTYSVCFEEKTIKEGEVIIKEDEPLNESKIFIYFILKGEFQANCKKNIFQIDEVIKLLGQEENISDTFPKELKSILDTKYYNEIASKAFNLKLNFFSKNDIIGLSEVFIKDKYFNNIVCTNSDSKVFCVDMRIIKLLVDSDINILNNKNDIVYRKYQMLCDILLKQRKIFFDSFFNIEKHNLNQNVINKDNNETENDNIIDLNEKYKNKEILGDKFSKSFFDKDKNKFISFSIRTMNKFNQIKQNSFEDKLNQLNTNPYIIKNMKKIKKKSEIFDNKKKVLKNLGDLDKMLANLNGNFTLADKRLERSMEFRKKYLKKMEKMNEEKKLREEERKKRLENKTALRRNQSGFAIKGFQKSVYIYRHMFKELPLLPNKDNNIKSDGQYKLIIPYHASILKKSGSTNNINPLAYDDFNRYYNTTQYFNFKENKENEEKKGDIKKEYFEYNIEFKSDMKLKDKKDNKLMRNNLLTKKLRSIYKGKLDKILYKKYKS